MTNKPSYVITWDEYLQTYVATCDTMPLLNGTGCEPLHAFRVLLLKISDEDAKKHLPYQDPLYTGNGSGFDW